MKLKRTFKTDKIAGVFPSNRRGNPMFSFALFPNALCLSGLRSVYL